MKTLLLAVFCGVSLQAQSLSFYIDNSQGAQVQALPSAYPFANTSVGQSTSIMVSVVNTSASPLTITNIYVGAAPGSSVATGNFSVTNFQIDAVLAPGGSKPFYLNFTPTAAGTASGYLQASIAGQNTPIAVSTLSGTGLSSSVVLTCQDKLLTLCDGKTPIKPNASLLFGGTTGVPPTDSYSIPFVLTNNTTAAIQTPTISTEVYAVAPFASSDLPSPPATIAPGATFNFTVVFTAQASAAGPSTPETATLTVGSSTYALQGYEAIVNTPQITCVYSTGKPCQGSANTFAVGPLSTTLSLVFTVTNPNPVGTSFADIVLSPPPAISDTADFTLSSATLVLTGSSSGATAIAPGQDITIQPGYSLTFKVTFTGSSAASGTLSIAYSGSSGTTAGSGAASYTLNGQPAPVVGSTQSDLPGITLMCGSTPCSSTTFTSEQQVQATLQVTTATTAGATLGITFKSLVSGVTDPAVTFIAPYTQQNLNFSFTTASLSGMLSNGQPQFTFQTGTTAGTINFTLTDSATLQTITLPAITIQPSRVQITSSTAVRSSPNLILTITGYDNTYSAGPLSFTFYDVKGVNLTPTAIQVNATNNFQQYFFSSSNQTGGAFSLQVTFPVSGDVTQVGSVTAGITNSAGQSSLSTNFQ